MHVHDRWRCSTCGEELPERTEWHSDGSISRVPGKCTNPDCEKSLY